MKLKYVWASCGFIVALIFVVQDQPTATGLTVVASFLPLLFNIPD